MLYLITLNYIILVILKIFSYKCRDYNFINSSTILLYWESFSQITLSVPLSISRFTTVASLTIHPCSKGIQCVSAKFSI